jgi:cell division transport system ATP-binding protein
MIQFSKVSATYPGSRQTILESIDLLLDKGVFGVVEGATGAGKSTLVKVLTCQLPMHSGTAIVGSYDIDKLNGGKRARYLRSIGLISNDFHLLEEKTVQENIHIAIDIQSAQARYDRDTKVEKVIDRYELDHYRRLFPRQLSHGEQQRVALARAVVREPLLLIADEPTASLDRASATVIRESLFAEHARGMTILVLTTNAAPYRHALTKLFRLGSGLLIEVAHPADN